jgi:hypothetical protein
MTAAVVDGLSGGGFDGNGRRFVACGFALVLLLVAMVVVPWCWRL